jgi:hypothetical protein
MPSTSHLAPAVIPFGSSAAHIFAASSARTVQPRAQGADRAAERVGGLAVCEFLQVAEHHCLPVAKRRSQDRCAQPLDGISGGAPQAGCVRHAREPADLDRNRTIWMNRAIARGQRLADEAAAVERRANVGWHADEFLRLGVGSWRHVSILHLAPKRNISGPAAEFPQRMSRIFRSSGKRTCASTDHVHFLPQLNQVVACKR